METIGIGLAHREAVSCWDDRLNRAFLEFRNVWAIDSNKHIWG